jgi:hypothetical protein
VGKPFFVFDVEMAVVRPEVVDGNFVFADHCKFVDRFCVFGALLVEERLPLSVVHGVHLVGLLGELHFLRIPNPDFVLFEISNAEEIRPVLIVFETLHAFGVQVEPFFERIHFDVHHINLFLLTMPKKYWCIAVIIRIG